MPGRCVPTRISAARPGGRRRGVLNVEHWPRGWPGGRPPGSRTDALATLGLRGRPRGRRTRQAVLPGGPHRHRSTVREDHIGLGGGAGSPFRVALRSTVRVRRPESTTSASEALFLAGARPLDSEGRVIGAGDHHAQAEKVLDHLLTVLDRHQAGPEHLVKTTIYVVGDREDLIAVWGVVSAGLAPHRPPSILIGVTVPGYRDSSSRSTASPHCPRDSTGSTPLAAAGIAWPSAREQGQCADDGRHADPRGRRPVPRQWRWHHADDRRARVEPTPRHAGRRRGARCAGPSCPEAAPG
jgi:enamine deaminase RidA (YjgF/YER057c/UK114 family)